MGKILLQFNYICFKHILRNMKLLTLIFSIFFISFSIFSQSSDTTKTFIDKTKIQIKLTDAKHKYYQHNYRASIIAFKEVLALDKTNSKANYGIAQCEYALKNFSKAKEHVTKAYNKNRNVDSDVHFLMGNIYFRTGELELAKKFLTKFKSQIKESKSQEYDIDLILNQIAYAKESIKSPIDVTIYNMGEIINSKSPEFAPCISQDGKYMVFTSRRANTKGGGIDVNFDHMYYTDIYLCEWDENTNDWGEPSNTLGKVNTEYHDGGLSFTADNSLLIYRNIYNVTRSGDIYISKQAKSGNWATPKPIAYRDKKIRNKINSSYFESSASITADGQYIYFVSERPGGQGLADIYYVKKSGKTYTEPKNLGSSINTTNDEKCVFIHPDGNVLFFTSNGRAESIGSYDIYYCTGGHGNWSEPKNLGYPINTFMEEKTISVSKDGKTAYVGAYYDIDSRGDADLFKIDISKLNLVE